MEETSLEDEEYRGGFLVRNVWQIQEVRRTMGMEKKARTKEKNNERRERFI